MCGVPGAALTLPTWRCCRRVPLTEKSLPPYRCYSVLLFFCVACYYYYHDVCYCACHASSGAAGTPPVFCPAAAESLAPAISCLHIAAAVTRTAARPSVNTTATATNISDRLFLMPTRFDVTSTATDACAAPSGETYSKAPAAATTLLFVAGTSSLKRQAVPCCAVYLNTIRATHEGNVLVVELQIYSTRIDEGDVSIIQSRKYSALDKEDVIIKKPERYSSRTDKAGFSVIEPQTSTTNRGSVCFTLSAPTPATITAAADALATRRKTIFILVLPWGALQLLSKVSLAVVLVIILQVVLQFLLVLVLLPPLLLLLSLLLLQLPPQLGLLRLREVLALLIVLQVVPFLQVVVLLPPIPQLLLLLCFVLFFQLYVQLECDLFSTNGHVLQLPAVVLRGLCSYLCRTVRSLRKSICAAKVLLHVALLLSLLPTAAGVVTAASDRCCHRCLHSSKPPRCIFVRSSPHYHVTASAAAAAASCYHSPSYISFPSLRRSSCSDDDDALGATATALPTQLSADAAKASSRPSTNNSLVTYCRVSIIGYAAARATSVSRPFSCSRGKRLVVPAAPILYAEKVGAPGIVQQDKQRFYYDAASSSQAAAQILPPTAAEKGKSSKHLPPWLNILARRKALPSKAAAGVIIAVTTLGRRFSRAFPAATAAISCVFGSTTAAGAVSGNSYIPSSSIAAVAVPLLSVLPVLPHVKSPAHAATTPACSCSSDISIAVTAAAPALSILPTLAHLNSPSTHKFSSAGAAASLSHSSASGSLCALQDLASTYFPQIIPRATAETNPFPFPARKRPPQRSSVSSTRSCRPVQGVPTTLHRKGSITLEAKARCACKLHSPKAVRLISRCGEAPAAAVLEVPAATEAPAQKYVHPPCAHASLRCTPVKGPPATHTGKGVGPKRKKGLFQRPLLQRSSAPLCNAAKHRNINTLRAVPSSWCCCNDASSVSMFTPARMLSDWEDDRLVAASNRRNECISLTGGALPLAAVQRRSSLVSPIAGGAILASLKRCNLFLSFATGAHVLTAENRINHCVDLTGETCALAAVQRSASSAEHAAGSSLWATVKASNASRGLPANARLLAAVKRSTDCIGRLSETSLLVTVRHNNDVLRLTAGASFVAAVTGRGLLFIPPCSALVGKSETSCRPPAAAIVKVDVKEERHACVTCVRSTKCQIIRGCFNEWKTTPVAVGRCTSTRLRDFYPSSSSGGDPLIVASVLPCTRTNRRSICRQTCCCIFSTYKTSVRNSLIVICERRCHAAWRLNECCSRTANASHEHKADYRAAQVCYNTSGKVGGERISCYYGSKHGYPSGSSRYCGGSSGTHIITAGSFRCIRCRSTCPHRRLCGSSEHCSSRQLVRKWGSNICSGINNLSSSSERSRLFYGDKCSYSYIRAAAFLLHSAISSSSLTTARSWGSNIPPLIRSPVCESPLLHADAHRRSSHCWRFVFRQSAKAAAAAASWYANGYIYASGEAAFDHQFSRRLADAADTTAVAVVAPSFLRSVGSTAGAGDAYARAKERGTSLAAAPPMVFLNDSCPIPQAKASPWKLRRNYKYTRSMGLATTAAGGILLCGRGEQQLPQLHSRGQYHREDMQQQQHWLLKDSGKHQEDIVTGAALTVKRRTLQRLLPEGVDVENGEWSDEGDEWEDSGVLQANEEPVASSSDIDTDTGGGWYDTEAENNAQIHANAYEELRALERVRDKELLMSWGEWSRAVGRSVDELKSLVRTAYGYGNTAAASSVPAAAASARAAARLLDDAPAPAATACSIAAPPSAVSQSTGAVVANPRVCERAAATPSADAGDVEAAGAAAAAAVDTETVASVPGAKNVRAVSPAIGAACTREEGKRLSSVERTRDVLIAADTRSAADHPGALGAVRTVVGVLEEKGVWQQAVSARSLEAVREGEGVLTTRDFQHGDASTDAERYEVIAGSRKTPQGEVSAKPTAGDTYHRAEARQGAESVSSREGDLRESSNTASASEGSRLSAASDVPVVQPEREEQKQQKHRSSRQQQDLRIRKAERQGQQIWLGHTGERERRQAVRSSRQGTDGPPKDTQADEKPTRNLRSWTCEEHCEGRPHPQAGKKRLASSDDGADTIVGSSQRNGGYPQVVKGDSHDVYWPNKRNMEELTYAYKEINTALNTKTTKSSHISASPSTPTFNDDGVSAVKFSTDLPRVSGPAATTAETGETMQQVSLKGLLAQGEETLNDHHVSGAPAATTDTFDEAVISYGSSVAGSDRAGACSSHFNVAGKSDSRGWRQQQEKALARINRGQEKKLRRGTKKSKGAGVASADGLKSRSSLSSLLMSPDEYRELLSLSRVEAARAALEGAANEEEFTVMSSEGVEEENFDKNELLTDVGDILEGDRKHITREKMRRPASTRAKKEATEGSCGIPRGCQEISEWNSYLTGAGGSSNNSSRCLLRPPTVEEWAMAVTHGDVEELNRRLDRGGALLETCLRRLQPLAQAAVLRFRAANRLAALVKQQLRDQGDYEAVKAYMAKGTEEEMELLLVALQGIRQGLRRHARATLRRIARLRKKRQEDHTIRIMQQRQMLQQRHLQQPCQQQSAQQQHGHSQHGCISPSQSLRGNHHRARQHHTHHRQYQSKAAQEANNPDRLFKKCNAPRHSSTDRGDRVPQPAIHAENAYENSEKPGRDCLADSNALTATDKAGAKTSAAIDIATASTSAAPDNNFAAITEATANAFDGLDGAVANTFAIVQEEEEQNEEEIFEKEMEPPPSVAYWLWMRTAMAEWEQQKRQVSQFPWRWWREAARGRKATHILYQELGREPTQEEVAERIGVAPDRWRDITLATRSAVSTEAEMTTTGGGMPGLNFGGATAADNTGDRRDTVGDFLVSEDSGHGGEQASLHEDLESHVLDLAHRALNPSEYHMLRKLLAASHGSVHAKDTHEETTAPEADTTRAGTAENKQGKVAYQNEAVKDTMITDGDATGRRDMQAQAGAQRISGKLRSSKENSSPREEQQPQKQQQKRRRRRTLRDQRCGGHAAEEEQQRTKETQQRSEEFRRQQMSEALLLEEKERKEAKAQHHCAKEERIEQYTAGEGYKHGMDDNKVVMLPKQRKEDSCNIKRALVDFMNDKMNAKLQGAIEKMKEYEVRRILANLSPQEKADGLQNPQALQAVVQRKSALLQLCLSANTLQGPDQ